MREKPVFKKILDFEEAKQLIEQMRRDRGYPSGYKYCGTRRFAESKNDE